ncbi:hypothetical protein COB57_05995 [Candidatus Peregrinibacteria bacterium]|nr:MAG: hypothetical protein COB57_05995 [Candidatus Peregrinibacteria bacterium]
MKIAVRAIIIHEKKALLVQHHGRDFFALPGGKIEEGENLQAALVREIEEELGVTPEIGKMLYVHEFCYPGGDMSIEFFFLVNNGQDFKGELKGSHTEAEIAEISWKNIYEKLDIMPRYLQFDLPQIAKKSYTKETQYRTEF